MTTGKSFVDTNIFVYAIDSSDVRKQSIASSVLRDLLQSERGTTSIQVLDELYVVVTSMLSKPLPRNDARAMIDTFRSWVQVLPDPDLILEATILEERDSVSFWDALIVSAALRSGATFLLTEDLQHDRSFGRVRIRNPFLEF